MSNIEEENEALEQPSSSRSNSRSFLFSKNRFNYIELLFFARVDQRQIRDSGTSYAQVRKLIIYRLLSCYGEIHFIHINQVEDLETLKCYRMAVQQLSTISSLQINNYRNLKYIRLSETEAEHEVSGSDQNTTGARMAGNGSEPAEGMAASDIEGEDKLFNQVKSSSSFVVKGLISMQFLESDLKYHSPRLAVIVFNQKVSRFSPIHDCINIAEAASSPAELTSSQTQSHYAKANPMRVAFSYRSETNGRVKGISQLVHDNIATLEFPDPIFYAPNFQSEIAEQYGMNTLQRIYQRADLVVVFLSRTYHNSPCCYNEWRAIKARFFVGCQDQQRERLPSRRTRSFC